jgi:hypothetical protein
MENIRRYFQRANPNGATEEREMLQERDAISGQVYKSDGRC